MERLARRTILLATAAAIIVPVALVLALTPVLSAQRSATQPESETATFNIFGLVASPGSYAWAEGMTVKQAVALEGGYSRRRSKGDLQIRRWIDGKLVSIVVKEDDPRPDRLLGHQLGA